MAVPPGSHPAEPLSHNLSHTIILIYFQLCPVPAAVAGPPGSGLAEPLQQCPLDKGFTWLDNIPIAAIIVSFFGELY